MRVPLRLKARGDHRRRRRRRRDPRQSPARRHAGGHAAAGARRQAHAAAATSSTGKVSLLIDLRTGRFDIVISGGMTRYLIPGLGIVDVETELHVVPGAERQGRG